VKKKEQAPSIQSSMVKGIILCVLLPLFAALLVLGVLMQRAVSSGITEAYQMMFDQSVREIDSAILESNYVSSTMITYTENNRLLKNYYLAKTDYEKSVALKKIRNMILNCNVSNLGSFGGELMILMKDGRLISSEKDIDATPLLEDKEWLEKLMESRQDPYWDREISELFSRGGTKGYVSFGRELNRYQQNSYGYALISIPESLFTRTNDDPRYQKGCLAMFAADGRLLTGESKKISAGMLEGFLQEWLNEGQRQGRYGDYYVMGARLSSSRNIVLYVGRRHAIFERSEMILWYVGIFMMAITFVFVGITLYISRYITEPILFFADRIKLIGHNHPEELTLKENHFLETQALEQGMLRAQKQIHLLVERVRQEATMKEKARFDALKAQIKPHFLFNTLNAIRWKASINGDQEVADILSSLGILLSETYKNDNELETIGNAVYTLEAYTKIMQVRFGNQVAFFSLIPDELQDYLIPRFCLQPLVENSFIHGMSHVENGVIALRGELSEKDIELTLIDNGSGLQGKELDFSRESEPNKRGITGIGLSNIHKRIQMLYGKGYGLSIDLGTELGFKISLRIPAVKREAEHDEGIDSGR